MRKKILTLCLVVALAATAVIGGTLAYFTDNDSDVNTMVSGNVDIIQSEKSADGSAYIDGQKLMPAVYDGDEVLNAIDKVVTVTNAGSEAAYVRTFIVYEDNLEPDMKIGTLLNPDADDEGLLWTTAFEADLTIGGKTGHYEVWMVTYTEALAPNATTVPSLQKVWLTPDVTQEDRDIILGDDDQLTIIAFSQAVQAAGFDNADDAFEAAYGSMDDMTDAQFSAWLAEANVTTPGY